MVSEFSIMCPTCFHAVRASAKTGGDDYFQGYIAYGRLIIVLQQF